MKKLHPLKSEKKQSSFTSVSSISFILIALSLMIITIITSQYSSAAEDIDIQKYKLSYDFFSGALFDNPEICSCSSFTDKIIIKNTGSFGAVFGISTNVEFAKIPINTVSLEPGKSAEIAINIDAPCTETGARDYVVNIKSNLDREQQIKRTLSIKKCQTINAALFSNKNSILPCESVNYTINITNQATFAEQYLIEPIYFKDYFESKAYSLNLNPGATGYVNTAVKFDCEEYGNKTIAFRISSINNRLSAQLSHNVEIKQEYGFSANIPESYEACQDENSGFYILVKNNASMINGFNAELVGAPKFVSLENSYFSLEPGKSDSFKLAVSAPKKSAGEYKFKVRIKSDLGDNNIERELLLNVTDCYTLSVTINGEKNPDVCSGPAEFVATVENQGMFSENVSLYLDSSGIGRLSQEKIYLKPSESKDVKILVNITEEMNGQQVYLLLSGSLSGRQTNETWSDSMMLKAYDQYQCTKVALEKNRIYARYYSENAVLGIMSLAAKDSEYRIFIDPNDKIRTDQKLVFIRKGETAYVPLNLSFNGSEPRNNYFNITLKSLDNKQDYVTTLRVTVSGTPFAEKAYAYISSSLCKTFFGILVLFLIVAVILFVIRIFSSTSTYRNQIRFAWFIVMLIVVVIILGLIIFGIPKPYYQKLNESLDPLYIKWYEDSSKKIDLSSYFEDPDKDSLIYEALDEPENISLKIEQGIVKFTPDKNWYGNSRIRFKATDPAGESAVSSRITLEVVDKPELDRYSFHTIYCRHINVLLIILILLVIMVTPWRKKPRDENKVAETKIKKEKGYIYFIDAEGDVARRRSPVRVPKPKRNR